MSDPLLKTDSLETLIVKVREEKLKAEQTLQQIFNTPVDDPNFREVVEGASIALYNKYKARVEEIQDEIDSRVHPDLNLPGE